MSQKLKIGVLYGGVSSEREVSINTGTQISQNLNRDKYEVFEILVDDKKDVFKCEGLDFVFIALHGSFGEDGQVQSILDALGVKYNGCDFFTSSICMNKKMVKDILSNYGVKMSKGELVKKGNYNLENLDLSFPIVVKPNSGGSSVGVSICKNKEELLKSLDVAFLYDDKILIEEFIDGQEITCGILNRQALPILKIIPTNGEFFNYECKYDNTTIEELAKFDLKLDDEIKKQALKIYDTLNCRVYARIDFIVKENVPYFLEINTLPGMTEGSLFPKIAKEVGMDFKTLIDEIITSSMNFIQ